MSTRKSLLSSAFLPPPGLPFFFSVVCGNSRLQWSYHDEDYAPKLNWRTKVPEPSSGVTLMELLPEEFTKQLVFGENGKNINDAMNHLTKNRWPMIYVYTISTNKKAFKGLQSCFKNLPAQIIELSAQEFSKSLGVHAYDTMGGDRIAGYAGAKYHHPHCPVLLIDGGTAFTSTTVENKQLGGNIGPGLKMKFRSLFDYSLSLPRIDPAKLQELLNESEKSNQTLAQLASTDTPLATEYRIANTVLTEATLFLANTIDQWLEKLREPTSTGSDYLPTVVLAGGDGDIYKKLLQKDHSGYIATNAMVQKILEGAVNMSDENRPTDARFQLASLRWVIHHGVQSLLESSREAVSTSPLEHTRQELLGQRVIVKANKMKWGILFAIERKSDNINEDVYKIFFDDATRGKLSITELYGTWLFSSGKGKKEQLNSHSHTAMFVSRCSGPLRQGGGEIETHDGKRAFAHREETGGRPRSLRDLGESQPERAQNVGRAQTKKAPSHGSTACRTRCQKSTSRRYHNYTQDNESPMGRTSIRLLF